MKRTSDETESAPPPGSGQTAMPDLTAGPLLTRADIESFARLGVEVEVESPLGRFWVVPAATGGDRLELTAETVMLLANAAQIFGGHIVSIAREGQPLAAAATSPAAVDEPSVASAAAELTPDDARAHLRGLRQQQAAQRESPARTRLLTKEGLR